MKPKPTPPPEPPTRYDHCVVCGAAKRSNSNPYCHAHADLAK